MKSTVSQMEEYCFSDASLYVNFCPKRQTGQYNMLKRRQREEKRRSIRLSIIRALFSGSFSSSGALYSSFENRIRVSCTPQTTIAPKIKRKWTRTQNVRAVRPWDTCKEGYHTKHLPITNIKKTRTDGWTSGEEDIVDTSRAVRERKSVTRRLTLPGTTFASQW